MSLISVSDMNKSYVTQEVLRDVSFRIEENDKIGIIGINGAGKTTLFRILTGEEDCDGGEVFRDKTASIAYMHQHADYTSKRNAIEEVTDVFSHLVSLESEIDVVNKAVADNPDEQNLSRQQRLREEFEEKGGLTFRSRIRSTLIGLGFDEKELLLPLEKLSGGQRTRVLLARILLSDAKLILLDEPTNHLDMESTRWLEDFLASYKGAVAVISHDRYFLDRVCTRIFELENKRLICYKGNYTAAAEQKALARKTAERDFEKKEKEIKRIEGIIEQQKRFNQERNYITIKSKQKQIDRIKDELVRPDKDPASIGFSFKACSGTGNDVLIAEHITKSFGTNTLFADANLLVNAGDRVFITGPNGCGKTTLLRMIIGEDVPTSGRLSLGARVQIGYYDQNISGIDPNKSIFDELGDTFPQMTNTQIRSALGVFLFKGDDVFKLTGTLSGGEKARVELAKLMLSSHNVLILDEPTNHLDIASKEALEDALSEYDGTIIAVSHDRYFINKLATRIFDFDKGSIQPYNGGYEFFLQQKSRFSVPANVAVKSDKSDGAEAFKRKKEEEAARRKKASRITKLEQLLDECAAKKKTIEAQLSDTSIASDFAKISELSAQFDAVSADEDAYYTEWAELQEE